VIVDGASVGAVASYTFTNVTAAHTISATFGLSSYTITASAGANGSISPSGPVSVASGSSQTFTISPAAGYRVQDVLVDSVSVGAVGSYTFANVTADHMISASFTQITYTLTVVKSGTGSGTVTSSPAAINCGGTCSATFPAGAQVVLTAAADAGSVFDGWTAGGVWGTFSGVACTGTAPCTITMNSNKTLAAAFTGTTLSSLTVVSPNGGEMIKQRTKQQITWSYTGNPGSTVAIELLKGGTVVQTLATAAPVGSTGTGSYSWSVNRIKTLGTDFKIRITGSAGVGDMSDGNFSIIK